MEPERRSWRTWSDLAQRAILAYIALDLLAYGYAALPGGMPWSTATLGGFWLFVDAFLFWKMLHGSRAATLWSFAIALMPAVALFLTQLPVWGFNEAHTSYAGYAVGFGLPQAILLAIAIGAEDRDESEGNAERLFRRPQSTP